MPHLQLITTEEQEQGTAKACFRPFSDLIQLPPEPDWLWRGLLAPGSLTMLAGHPFAGKSMLVGGLLKAMQDGTDFLGRTTKRATAVLLTEEDAGGLRARAGMLKLLELECSYRSRNEGVLTLAWPALIAEATEHALRAQHALLIVDTFPGLAGLADEQENDAGAIAKRLRPLQEAAGRGLSVLFLHHMNALGQPRGSRAFRGVADIAIRFFSNKKTRIVHLETESRFPTGLPSTLKAKLIKAPDGWFYEVINQEQPRSARRQSLPTDERLRNALADAGSSGLTYTEIGRVPGLSVDKAKRRLPRWRRAGTVRCVGTGRKTSPYRWISSC